MAAAEFLDKDRADQAIALYPHLGSRSIQSCILASILTQKSGSPALLNLGYSYYANGQIQQIANNLDSLKTEKYTYDELRRLLTAQRGPDTNIQRKYSYDYDRFGNRWGQTLVAGSGFGGTNSFDYTNNRVTSPNSPSTTPSTSPPTAPAPASPSTPRTS